MTILIIFKSTTFWFKKGNLMQFSSWFSVKCIVIHGHSRRYGFCDLWLDQLFCKTNYFYGMQFFYCFVFFYPDISYILVHLTLPQNRSKICQLKLPLQHNKKRKKEKEKEGAGGGGGGTEITNFLFKQLILNQQFLKIPLAGLHWKIQKWISYWYKKGQE